MEKKKQETSYPPPKDSESKPKVKSDRNNENKAPLSLEELELRNFFQPQHRFAAEFRATRVTRQKKS